MLNKHISTKSFGYRLNSYIFNIGIHPLLHTAFHLFHGSVGYCFLNIAKFVCLDTAYEYFCFDILIQAYLRYTSMLYGMVDTNAAYMSDDKFI